MKRGTIITHGGREARKKPDDNGTRGSESLPECVAVWTGRMTRGTSINHGGREARKKPDDSGARGSENQTQLSTTHDD